MFKKDIFGNFIIVRKTVIRIFGFITYYGFSKKNTPEIKGAELLKDLPKENVLFISNHQTYFADVAFMTHVFHTAMDGKPNTVSLKSIIKCKLIDLYYVAAAETMKAGLLPKILAMSGAITIKRTWRESGKEIKREVDMKDTANIQKALNVGWVITFPQGTTKAFAPGRKGTAHIIKNYQPIVVPIVINGFRRAFDKKGLLFKMKGTKLQLTIKPPIKVDYDDYIENILQKVMESIEQSRKFEWRSSH